MGLITSASRRIGAISISMAPMKATKPPTVTMRSLPDWPCDSAMPITTESATADTSCVSGMVAAEARVAFSASRRRSPESSAKRSPCACSAPCRRIMRCASTFSSTT